MWNKARCHSYGGDYAEAGEQATAPVTLEALPKGLSNFLIPGWEFSLMVVCL